MDEDKGLYYRPLTPLTIYQLLHRSLVLAESWDSESIKHVIQGRLSSKDSMPVSLMAAVGFGGPDAHRTASCSKTGSHSPSHSNLSVANTQIVRGDRLPPA